MNTLTPFQKEALRFDKHIALTANAGSGKTFVLAKRFVEIALEKNLQLNKLVAITFTEKAAGELYSKIAKEINERLNSETDASRIKILRRLRRQLVSANISTIHSFCTDLIKEFATEIGVDTNFRPVDARVSNEFLDVTIEDFINSSLRQSDNNEISELVRLFGSVRILIRELKKLLSKRKTVIKIADDFKDKSSLEIAGNLRLTFEKKFQEYFGNIIQEFFEEVKALNSAVLSAYPQNKYGQTVAEILTAFGNQSTFVEKILIVRKIIKAISTKDGKKIRTRDYSSKVKKMLAGELLESLEQKRDVLNSIGFSDNPDETELSLVKYQRLLLSLFEKILSEYEKKKKSLGYLDFEDLLIGASKILENQSARKTLAERFEFIMVDEYQDTNEIQYEIIMPLLEKLKNGNLFVVGDDKQSIYMFREAELEIFEKTKEEIKIATGGEGIVELPHSFRLAPNIALFANKIFERIFANPSTEFNEVTHSNLICARGEEEGGKVEILAAEETEEAQLIAGKILQLKSLGLNYKEIAILCRKREWFKELSDVFSQRGIPFTILGSKGFYQNQIVLDIFNFLSFLLDNRNDAALVTILRSPFFYFKDNLLLKINFEKGETFFEKLKAFAFQDKDAAGVVKFLEAFTKLANELPLNELLRKIVTESGYLAIISSRENSDLQLANLEKLITLSNNFQNEPFHTFYDFVEFLRSSIEGYEDESEAELISEENKVQLMTIHQAKGLEFKVVFIYHANTRPNLPYVKAKSVSIDKDYGIITKVPTAGNYFEDYKVAPIVGLYNYYLKRKELAENKRLFYVATTRARDYLFLSISKMSKPEINSFWALTVNGLGIKDVAERIELSGNLDFMKFDRDKHSIFTRQISFGIPIVKETMTGVSAESNGKEFQAKLKNYSYELSDIPKNEIFSATRIATYEQCPFKYKLIYELGYAKLEKLLREGKIFFDAEDEAEETKDIPQNVKGSIIHRILEKDIQENELSEFVKKSLEAEDFPIPENTETVEEIVQVVRGFKNSNEFKSLRNYDDYKNEFQIYLRQNDYFLFGILDKLIFTKEKFIIVDYKTDSLDKGEGKEKFEHYKQQLFFYAFLVNKYFSSPKPIELRLLFVRKPEETIIQLLESSIIEQYKRQLIQNINNIQSRIFPKNKNHCRECQFGVNGDCRLENLGY